MSDKLAQTQAMLARHHRDGKRMAEMMTESFERRFDEAFWTDWARWMAPVYSEQPVVLDLGAGPGMLTAALAERHPGLRAVGVECASYMLDAAVDLPAGAELICHDLHDPHLPFDDGSVDAAVSSVVVHEMNQPLSLLRELYRCLRPGGRFFLLDWVRAPLELYVRAQTDEARLFSGEPSLEELDDLFIHFMEHNRFSREDLIYLLNACGFSVIHSEIHKEGRYAKLVAEKREG